ncbi:DNA polymerase IV [Zobellella maritima]|uniref:DNA polymerase IV n=1 Tax=Zobellella maritima TaxID=2059725 RepID=UPI000E308DC5|nr:DNA polymerase IV [Zobellella maritima]
MRKIIHIDMDCFFAAVEMRDHPEWQEIPLAIGGSVSRRGVIATCNYPARAYGVRSAMPSHRALQQCPHLLLIPGNMALYKAVSAQLREIFQRYTPLVEPLSLDEAYLDVTDSPLFRGSATRIAEDIRRTIRDELQLTASAGVAPNKFLAKIASEENKPDGLFVLPPEAVADFLYRLPLARIPGVGRKTTEKLAALGLDTCGQLPDFGEAALVQHFGKFGQSLWQRCQGRDERPVQVERIRKSVGVETTLAADIYGEAEGETVLAKLWPDLLHRLAERPIKGLCIKLKFSDFQQTTLSRRSIEPDWQQARILLEQAWSRRRGRGVRLVGISVELGEHRHTEQLSLDWH